ncbi:hypothetical protein HanHA300_Chr04g0133801 [Helianthus annuus]|nr:hypothetical protein HanHA300_Chr04g0133801 [Helianthus annuus]KAJ0596763.1 hypothetical protein HanHA89_Chr04g0146671 [Helianthus annuus]KAJ0757443.1 hypothetical protein HanLR1_Chr04g0138801 [Helianthus annuus]KAJ0761142.1 hypothetical protein HanOQP8_Chr04g0146331 [Helianthus annuus]
MPVSIHQIRLLVGSTQCNKQGFKSFLKTFPFSLHKIKVSVNFQILRQGGAVPLFLSRNILSRVNFHIPTPT